MKFDQRFEFYEKLYFHERDLWEKIESRYRTPLTLFAALFPFIGFLSRELFIAEAVPYNFLVWVPLSASIALFVFAVYFLSRSMYGYHYQLMPTPDVLEEYREEIKTEYFKISPEEAIDWTNTIFEEYLFCLLYTSPSPRDS